MHSRFQEIATKDQTDLVQRREKDSLHGLAYLLSAPPAPGARHGCLIQPESRRYTASSPSPLAVAAPGPASNPRLGAPYTSRYAVGAQPSAHHPLACRRTPRLVGGRRRAGSRWLTAAEPSGWRIGPTEARKMRLRPETQRRQPWPATAPSAGAGGGVSLGRRLGRSRAAAGDWAAAIRVGTQSHGGLQQIAHSAALRAAAQGEPVCCILSLLDDEDLELGWATGPTTRNTTSEPVCLP